MGCGSGMFSPYTKEEIDMEIDRMTPGLPMAQLMNGGIIKLEGANGFFNPRSLLDPSWLKGRLSPEEYFQAIDYINRTTGYSHIGLSKIYSTSERAMRANLRTQAGQTAVDQLNRRHSGVRFTYQQTHENMQMNISNSADPAVQFATRHRAAVGNASVSVIYITFP